MISPVKELEPSPLGNAGESLISLPVNRIPLSRFLLSLFFLFTLTASFLPVLAEEKESDSPIRFGHPLFNEFDTLDYQDPAYMRLTPGERAVLNLRHTVDLFSKDIRFYHPDLVTPGREALLSPLGAGLNWSKATWNGRSWRDARTNRAVLNLLPPMMIGSAESSIGGGTGGEFGFGLLQLSPIEVTSRQALTSLHHREGFYGFAPVEFIHARPLSESSQLYLGGYFPVSTGRFPPHSGHKGQTLWSRYCKDWNEHRSLSISGIDGLHKVESPYQTTTDHIHRNDIDLNYRMPLYSRQIQFDFYRSESFYILDSMHTYGREWRAGIKYGQETLFGKFSAGQRDILLSEGTLQSDVEVSGAVAFELSIHQVDISGAIGGEGVAPKRIRPVGTLTASMPLKQVTLFGKLGQAVDTHSPEERFAQYRNFHLEEPLDPIRAASPASNLEGAVLPPTILHYGETGFVTPLFAGSLKATVYGWRETHSADWLPRLDTSSADWSLVWSEVADRSGEAWLGEYSWSEGEWRGNVSAVGVYQSKAAKSSFTEPPYRLQCEVGRHKFFYNGALEADFLLSGKYYSRFHSILEQPGEKLGGAFPIDARFTGRIGRFTFYYGLHNLNSAKYSLIPGYKMMHKEEYWGIDWLLID